MSSYSNFIDLLKAGLDRAGVQDGSKLVVAFSGGPDSSALLAGLAELSDQRRLSLVAVHVNHQIRGNSSDANQASAQMIAENLKVEFVATTVDVPRISAEQKISIESAARTSRYIALADAVGSHGARGVVTGHTLDDQAETVLQHAARGAGLRGVSGMRFNSVLNIPNSDIELNVLRPMLDTPRFGCIKYCRHSGIDPVIDESNASRDYTRNRLRLDVLPQLNAAIPEASQSLARLAKNSTDDLSIIEWVVEQNLAYARIDKHRYSRADLANLPNSLVGRMLIRAYELHVGHVLNLERIHITKMVGLLSGKSGTSIELPNTTEFYVDKDEFGFRFDDDDDCPYPSSIALQKLNVPGATELGSGVTLQAELIDRPQNLDHKNQHVTYAAPDLLTSNLNLRNRNNGDRFQPLGMNSHVKLQDFFVDSAVPRRWRNRVPIIDSAKGIVWIAGYRLADWAKVLPKHQTVARFELTGSKKRDQQHSAASHRTCIREVYLPEA
ncbi:MAG: tRNA lysidine(34) synthetase TilS [Chloroflexi bacterium]|jgi:tRNA(Ile)-lysidine synthase|nr:tRNA lysidine(34) synthetase TilS [Chloroflexota bacterium]MBT5893119.1 tRNA lysidine(34) synthetase TilS [Chloroflexota bacterium]MBT6706903.1 tRNA lysidine(34) synthetase TilS [Chloroflexota bacterium]MBT7003474.1 tRNA lysidine(34) synthetase TilS [Chloroflexota bacterium]MBT7833207.1 tRNA lysidine(34) synthetase TilS [Chloroflexota bacterium]